jgi:hypothetical protein
MIEMKLFYFLLIIPFLYSCQSLRQSSKFGFSEGYYKSRIFHKKLKAVYIVPGEDSIKVYTKKSLEKEIVDTSQLEKIAFPTNRKPGNFDNYFFKQNTFDIDILSILIKYRPSTSGFPNQFNSSILNGAVYLGYRSDFYHLRYNKTPLNTYKRKINHYAVSIGVFSGLGATRIDPYVTLNSLNIEYDGFVQVSGLAAIIAVNKLSCGLTFGIDHLLDRNRKLWIYQGKPWVGLSIGLNLN